MVAEIDNKIKKNIVKVILIHLLLGVTNRLWFAITDWFRDPSRLKERSIGPPARPILQVDQRDLQITD